MGGWVRRLKTGIEWQCVCVSQQWLTLARCSTLEVCPLNSLSLVMVLYFQRMSWLSLKPWEEMSSLLVSLHWMAHN